MRKIVFFIILLLTCTLLGYFGYNHFSQPEKSTTNIYESKLANHGYNISEIKFILENLNDQEIDLFMISDYKQSYNLLTNHDFNIILLNKYLTYANNNKSLAAEVIIDIVNNELDSLPFKPIYHNLINEPYYLKKNISRYLAYAELYPDYLALDIIRNVNTHLDYPFYSHNIAFDSSKGILSIANKYYTLPADFEGFDLVTIAQTNYQLNSEAYKAYQLMWQAASN